MPHVSPDTIYDIQVYYVLHSKLSMSTRLFNTQYKSQKPYNDNVKRAPYLNCHHGTAFTNHILDVFGYQNSVYIHVRGSNRPQLLRVIMNTKMGIRRSKCFAGFAQIKRQGILYRVVVVVQLDILRTES